MDVNHSGSAMVRNYSCAQENDPRHVKVVGWLTESVPVLQRMCNVFNVIMLPNPDCVISAGLFSAVF